MSRRVGREMLTAMLVFGGVVFGMVLAGGLDFTPAGFSASQPYNGPDAQVPAATPGAMPSLADLAEAVSPAVVSIEASSFERGAERRSFDPFEFFRPPRPEPEDDEDREFRSDSGGSGFVVSAEGLVVTNNHVIRGADRVRVHLGERTYDAEVKGSDPATDLALLQIEADGSLPFLRLGDSHALRVGDWVMAVGSPLGLDDTVTVGVVSAKGRRINISQETTSFESFIQTDAAINFGNSGGPLINLAGEVVGINTAINWGSENIGFAVPVNILKQILPQLAESGRVRRGYLGLGVLDLTPEAAEAFGLEDTDGAMVSQVLPELPAAEAGLQPGDVILRVDDVEVTNTRRLIDYVSTQGPDAEVELEVLRDGERLTLDVSLAERPVEGSTAGPTREEGESGIEWLGVRYQELTPGLRSMHGIPEDVEGVWLTQVSPRSPLYDEGVRTDRIINIIAEVNGEAVRDVTDFERLVDEAPGGSRLRIYIRRFQRGQEAQPLFVFPAKP